MADTIAELVTDLRKALTVDVSYETETLPAIVRRAMRKLLRDYHFPKSLIKLDFTNVVLGTQSYATPSGFKKEHLVRFYDPVEDQYTDPLLKREGRVLPQADGRAFYYWMEGTNLWTDVVIDEASAGITLELIYETMDVDTCEAWFVPDFEDVLFTFAMYRASAELRKTELRKHWKELWAEERTSLAIYTNELQYDSSELMMRAADNGQTEVRYAPND